jgi:hypothetical protein
MGRLEQHLGSRDVARVIYGAIIGLALVVALEHHPPGTSQIITALTGTAVAVALAHAYSEVVGEEAVTHRRFHLARVKRLLGESGAIAFGAAFPVVFFVLVALDAMETATAFTFSKWTGAGLICGYGYLAARLAGASRLGGALQAAGAGAIGLFLIGLKAALH